MDVTPVASQATATAQRAEATLAENFDSFLTLLTAQLQYQDPLDPIDSTEFVAQLVSFTGVEQAVATNANLATLIKMMESGQTAAAVDYLGTIVEAEGDTATLSGGAARFLYSVPETVTSTSVLIANDQGEIVYAGQGETAAGDHVFTWDGRDTGGVPQSDGVYTIRVSARTADNTLVPVGTMISGRVGAIESTGDGIVLVVDGVGVPLHSVVSVTEDGAP